MAAPTIPPLYHGYLVLISTFVLNFVAIGVFNSAGLYLGPLAASFPESGSGELALYCTLQIVAGLASSLAGGIAQHALERRGVGLQWLFFGGGGFMALGFFWSSMSYTLTGVLVGSALMGIGLGLGGFMAGGICVLWFEAARGTMLLLAMSGQGIGNVFFAWSTARLLQSYEDAGFEDPWRPTMCCMGVLSFLLCAIASMPMRLPLLGEVEEHENKADAMNEIAAPDNKNNNNNNNYGSTDDDNSPRKEIGDGKHPSKRKRSSAMALEQMCARTKTEILNGRPSIIRLERRKRSSMLGSFQAIGNAPLTNNWDSLSFMDDDSSNNKNNDFLPLVDENPLVSRRSLFGDVIFEREYTLSQLFFSSTSIWLNIFTIIACFPFLNMQVLLPPYIAALGMPPTMGGRALAMFGVGDFLSNLTLGAVADMIGARWLFAFAFLNLSVLFFLWPHCTTVEALSGVAFFYGYFCCTISSMPIIILADAYGESSSEHILALNGITNMFKFPGYLLGPSLAGVLVEWSGSYSLTAFFSGVTNFVGVLALLMIPSPEKQQQQLADKYRES